MSETHDLGGVTVVIDDDARTVTSRWPDGVELVAKPVYEDEAIHRADALGYGSRYNEWSHDVVWGMTRDHDLFHHIVARAVGKQYSWHLRHIAEGRTLDGVAFGGLKDEGHREERMVLLLQRACNVGRDGLLK